MQRFLFTTAVLSGLLLHGVLFAGQALNLESETDRISYSLGQQVGKDLKELGVDLDAAALVQGFSDANGGAAPVMGRQKMATILGSLKSRIRAAQREEAQARQERKQKEAEENRRRGQEFLASNGSKPGVTTLPSGLQYRVLKSGTGKKPGPQDMVQVRYRYRLISGHAPDAFDSDEETDSFRVGGVIRGLTEALQLMREGAKWEIYLPPELAFGTRGPMANRTVIYEIELLGIGEDGQAAQSQTASNGKAQ